jgi:hypothetical protein
MSNNNDWIKTQLEKMDIKLDKMDGRLDNLDITAVKQQAILEEHHKRSIANEAAVVILKEELKPVKEHVLKIDFIVKIIMWVIASVGSLTYIIRNLL